MAGFPESILDAIETRIADGLRRDAEGLGRMEATARVLLALSPDGVSMREMARRIARDPSTVTRFVEKAEDAGLVVRKPGLDDRRERLLFLTDGGSAARAALLSKRVDRDRALEEAVRSKTGLSAEEVAWFLRVLYDGLVERDGAVSA